MGPHLFETKFTWLGVDMTAGYVDVAEASATSPAREQFIRIQTLVRRAVRVSHPSALQNPQGSETLLDHSALVWISDTGEASSHSGASIPVVIAGGLGGDLKPGQYVKFDHRSQADLLVTFAKAFGDEKFGDPAFGARPLTELLLR